MKKGKSDSKEGARCDETRQLLLFLLFLLLLLFKSFKTFSVTLQQDTIDIFLFDGCHIMPIIDPGK